PAHCAERPAPLVINVVVISATRQANTGIFYMTDSDNSDKTRLQTAPSQVSDDKTRVVPRGASAPSKPAPSKPVSSRQAAKPTASKPKGIEAAKPKPTAQEPVVPASVLQEAVAPESIVPARDSEPASLVSEEANAVP